MTNDINIQIKSFFENKGAQQARDAINKLDNQTQHLTNNMRKIMAPAVGGDLFSQLVGTAGDQKQLETKNKFLNKFGLNLNNLADSAAMATPKYQKLQKALGAGAFQKYEKSLQKVNQTQKKLGERLQNVGRTFSMQFLGVMFAGMALKNAMQGVAKSTVSSFMKITEGSTSSGQAVNALTATFELLKFTVGEAVASLLEELLPVLAPLINRFADWIEQNKKLVGWLIFGSIAVGALLFIIGQLSLGIQAFANMIIRAVIGLVVFANTILGIVSSALMWLLTGGLIIMVTVFAAFIVLITLFVAAWKSDWNDIITFTKETLTILWDGMKVFAVGMLDIFRTMLDMIVAAFQGDWRKVWELTKKLGNQIFVLLAKLLASIIGIIGNLSMFIGRIIVDLVKGVVKGLAWMFFKGQEWGIRLGVALKNTLIGAFNDIKQEINRLIDKFADITVAGKKPFAWLKKLKTQMTPLQDVGILLREAALEQDIWNEALDKSAEDLKQDIFAPIEAETIRKVHDFIDANNEYAKSLEEMKQSGEDPFGIAEDDDESLLEKIKDVGGSIAETMKMISDDLGVTEKIEDFFENISAEFTKYKDQITETLNVTSDMTQQNYEHADSLAAVNRELALSVELHEQYRIAVQSGGGTDTIDLSDSVGNYVISDTNG